MTTPLSVAVDDLPGAEGTAFGPSEWRVITQEEVDDFARLSGDMNPIHIDPDFAATTSYGTTIVHGLFTLSLVVPLMKEILEVTGVGLGINYGSNRLRFPAPVPVGARIRVSGVLKSVTEVTGGYQVEVPVTFEVEGGEKPVLVTELVLRYYR
ncbi:MaoC family dehydratase [Microbacterium sp. SORGH_AS_0888]|uniref:MaoC family dehydratase n=1 Tax=Microbacterium sp. SORGH_AS_0888 TaxID=3041791 RepID=UPI00278197A2|nr:MaoC family dehydratase [Microbacterium sp. SORGH_AS_0888]MDQ1129674.1 acyl dehydratase [Microbacterium sp. SORGH_AS_0888]